LFEELLGGLVQTKGFAFSFQLAAAHASISFAIT
jgi:hypothetical protein